MRLKLPSIGKALLFSLIPFIAVIFYTLIKGVNFFTIDPLQSGWNDEVYYYKQIESVLNYGIPQGYFGYNESHATIGTFGAWSPFIMLPYLIFAFFFGLSPQHILIYNILMVVIAFFVFYLLVKPGLYNSLYYFISFLAFPFMLRYIASNMVEAQFIALVIVLAGMIIYCKNNVYKLGIIVAFYIIIFYLTLCRPYYMAFMIFPIYFHVRLMYKGEIKRAWLYPSLIGALFLVVSVAGYWFSGLLKADYFTDIVDLSVFQNFSFSFDGIISTAGSVFYRLFNTAYSIVTSIIVTVTNSAPNIWGIIYFVLISLTFVYVVFMLFTKNKKKSIDFHLLISCLLLVCAIMFAIMLFYAYAQGSRHVLAMIIFLVMGLPCYIKLEYKRLKIVIASITISFLTIISYNVSYDYYYYNYYVNNEFLPKIDAVELSSSFTINSEASPWDNTTSVLLSGISLNYAYYLPVGGGIQLVLDDYIASEFDGLKSKYFLMNRENPNRELFEEQGDYEVIALGEDYVMFERI